MNDTITISRQTLRGDDPLKGCRIVDCKLEEWIDLENCLLERCDLANLRVQRCGVHHVRFVDCRLTGSFFTDCDFRDVIFTDCIGRYLNCYGTSFRDCLMQRCDFSEGVFAQTKWKRSGMDACTMIRADFSGLSVDRLDVSNSKIEGALFRLEQLKGITVSSMQALSFAKMLGLEVK